MKISLTVASTHVLVAGNAPVVLEIFAVGTRNGCCVPTGGSSFIGQVDHELTRHWGMDSAYLNDIMRVNP